jgi:cytochrome b6
MSVKKLQDWFDDRLGLSEVFGFLTKKAIPQHKHTIWYYTGSAILLFFVIQVVTGFMLAFYYQPTLEQANASVARIISEVPLGWIFRSIHSWSSSFMIALVFIHLLSIWITKSYRKPREMTWMTGVLLMVVSLAFGFTGYLLPWDELSLSATKVGTDIPRTIPVVGQWVTSLLRGGGDVTGDTLTRFFGIHISILPVFAFLLLAVHIFLIQKHGISYPLEAEKHKERVKTIPFWPNFVYPRRHQTRVVFPVSLPDPEDLSRTCPDRERGDPCRPSHPVFRGPVFFPAAH